MRIMTWLAVIAGLVILAGISGYWLFHSEWFQKKYLYPFPYQDIVYQYAEERDLDPFLIAAVIRTESKFIPAARSPKGALGLMQMMPETGEWVARQLPLKNFSPELLIDPEVNISFGTWYLASLKREFNNNEILILAAYNGGRGNVKQWMSQYGWTDDFRDVNQIPFRETREYVGRVLRAEAKYRELYGR